MKYLHPRLESAAIDASGQDDVANREILARGIAWQDERIKLVAQEAGRATAEFLVDRIAELHIRRHRLAIAQLAGDHSAISRISQGLIERMTSHHVGVGHAVRPVLGVP